MIRRSLAVLLLAPAAAGCVSVFPKSVPAQFYSFNAGDPPAQAVPEPAGVPGAETGLVLDQVTLPRESASDGILTMTGDKAAYIAGARWVAPARVLFTEALQRRLGGGGGAVRLADLGDASARGLLRVDVTRFEADYGGGGPPKVRVSLVARLVALNGAVADMRQVAEEAQASENSVSAIIAAFAAAAGKSVADVAAFADQSAAKLAGPAPSAPAH